MHLHVIQDIATPHNNVLLAALKKSGIRLTLWYCEPMPGKYGWNESLANAVQPARLYHPNRLDFSLLWQVLKNPGHKVLLVGWSNPSTRALFILLCLLRRRFGMWFDLPEDNAPRSAVKNLLREAFYALLKRSRATVFSVGKKAVDYFAGRGFNKKQLVNLPIIVEVNQTRDDFAHQHQVIRARYNVGKSDILLVGGSRLVFDKGFDIPLTAIGALPAAQKKRVRLVIVGQGEELDNLKALAQKQGILGQVFFPGWLAYEDFQSLIAASTAFIHPARFDAWGATIFAHALGVPVIGSTGAGSAFDRISQGQNGWLFNPSKPAELTTLIGKLLSLKPAELKKMGTAARKTAESWKPSRGVSIVRESLG